nr:SMI1/KNR4 family protein [Promicromonospora thailandica]
MWRERVLAVTGEVELGAPVASEQIDRLEGALGWQVPAELRSFLLECNGLTAWSAEYVWPTGRILEINNQFNGSAEFETLYLPFDGLRFFGDNGGGDQFAFVDRAERSDIFVWEHEDDSRRWVANDLGDFLDRALSSGGVDWYL